MGERIQSKGICQLCKTSMGKAGMTRHLMACRKAHDQETKAKKEKVFHLLVEGGYKGIYWLHLEIPAAATLVHLDKYLRKIWLECCGHMSAFTIDGMEYSVQPMDDFEERAMDVALEKVLQPELKFTYEYDFGSTTELRLKVVGLYEGAVNKKQPIRLLARNDPPAISCGQCGQPATLIFEGGHEPGDWLCDQCAKQQEEDEEFALPVVNSPRVGVCGYTGE